ncbi:DUF72 domain-containing protein [Croceicoccus sp. BE223]|uniref:DUF72 domain-containing protein n=1 Tax=Croceicoccus sp. BE223 TaxID=2817716 RepID=UPI00286627E7|nr:DUF72 domain-containing protein [Croceicoccus sp. BE223]MDR7101400.1 uncharacterized protein YecE (DUF72 family) [Croceicoccus sp. BE223]
MTIRTGIGGWTFPEWRGVFYPPDLRQKDELAYAAAHLGAIEVNATFRRLQTPATFARWRDAVPEGFRFALKGSRYVVTRPRLADAGEAVARFCGQGIAELGDRLGPVLWQLSSHRVFDAVEMAAFFALLPRAIDGLPLQHVIEAGHPSFACEDFASLAREAGVAIAVVDAAGSETIDVVTTDFAYARLKNASERLKRGYPPAAIEEWARWALAHEAAGRDAWMFCINGAKVRAPAAAMTLARKIRAG